ncbi:MAG: dihydroneopterin aldolase [Muribaculaceae bacterium]|nr:dihydroneopterin aldolase [Muribaculaceae bacterium]
MMEYEIALTGLRFFGRHGVLEQEKKVGNEFIVDVKVRIPYSKEILSDDLEATISYADIYGIVSEEMGKPRKLLETVAGTIHSKIAHRWPQITSGSIKICKSNPPIAHISGSSEVTLFF